MKTQMKTPTKINIIIQPYNLSVPSPDSHRMHGYISRFDDLCDNRQEQVAYFGNPGPLGSKHIAVKSLEFQEIYRQVKLSESPAKYFARLDKRKHAMLCIQRYLYELQRLVTVENSHRIIIFDPYILYIIWVLTQYFKHNPYAQLNQRIQVIYTPVMQPMFTDSTLSKLIKDITLENAYPVHVLCADYKLTTSLISSGIHNRQLVKLPHGIFDDSKIQLNDLCEKIHVVIPQEALAKRDTLDSNIEIRVPAYYTIHTMNNWESNMEPVVCNMYSALEQIVDALVQKCKRGDLRLARHLTHQGIHVTWDIACFYTTDANIQNQTELAKYFAELDWQQVLDCRLLSMSLLPYLGPVNISIACEPCWMYRTMGINLLNAETPCLEFVGDSTPVVCSVPSSPAEYCPEHVRLPSPRILPEQPNEPITAYDTALDLVDELQTATYDFQPEHITDKSQLLMHPRDALNLDFRYESGDDKSAPHGTVSKDSSDQIEDLWILDEDRVLIDNIGNDNVSSPEPEKPSIPNPEITNHQVVMEAPHELIIELKEDDLPKFAPIVTKASLVESSVLDMAVDEWLDGAQFLAKCSARPGHILAISRTDKSQFIVHLQGVRYLDFRYGSGVPIYPPHGTQLHTDSIHGSNRFRYEPCIMEQVNSKYFYGLIPSKYDSPYKLYQHIGIESGLIMSRAQITRWFPDVIFETQPTTGQIMCGMLTDLELVSLSEFVTANIYGRSVDYFLGRCSILQSSVGQGTSNATTKYRLGVLIQCGSGQSAGKIAEELLEMALAMVGRVSVVIGINISMGINDNINDYSGLLNRLKSVKLPLALFAYVITSTPDLGTDISPFFMLFHTLTNRHGMDDDAGGLGLDIDYILKLHTKTNSDWRKRLCRPFIGGLDSIMGLLTRLDTDKTIGMLGAKECICPNNQFCDTKLETYFPECTYTKYRAQYRYVAGTIFLTRTHIIRDTIAMDPKFTKAMLLMPYYYDNSLFPINSPAHTFERIMGYLACKKYNQGVCGI